MFQSTQIVADLLAGVPLILLIVFVLRGKTVLPKSSQFFTPLLWIALLSMVKFLIPVTPLSNGIDTFCMNAGMMIWFSCLLVKEA